MYIRIRIKLKQVNKINVKHILLIFSVFLHFVTVKGQNVKLDFLKAVVSIDKKDYSDAVTRFTRLIENGSYKENSYFHRGKAYLLNKEYDKAIADFKKINGYNLYSLWISKAYAGMGKTDSALYYLEIHLSSADKEDEKKVKGDDAFDFIQETDEWFDFWQNEWYSQTEKQISGIAVQIDNKEYSNALNNILTLMDSVSDSHQLYYQRARLFCAQKNYKGALSDINSSIRINPKSEYILLKAKINRNMGRYDKALEDINSVLKSDPEKAGLYKERAEIHYYKKDFSQAMRDILFYLDLYDNDLEALLILGKTNYKKGELLEALKIYNRILQRDQSKAEYYKLRGITYYETGTYKYAIGDLSMALDLDPDDGETYLYKALARYKSGDTEGACMDFKNAEFYGEMQAIEYMLEYCE